MVYSLTKADRWLNNYNCIISYSDIFYEKKAIEILKKNKKSFVVLNNKKWLKNWNRYFIA